MSVRWWCALFRVSDDVLYLESLCKQPHCTMSLAGASGGHNAEPDERESGTV